MKKILERLERAQSRYEAAFENAEERLEGKVLFSFYISYVHSDGLVLGNTDNAMVAPLDLCLEMISEKTLLTPEDHKDICI